MLFREGTYLVTGATGFLGGMIVERLTESAGFKEGRIRVAGVVRDKRRPAAIPGGGCGPGMTLLEADVRDRERLFSVVDMPVDYIIHCATVTQSSEMIKHPVEVADGIVLGTRNILGLAAKRQVKGMVYLSSMEAYGTVPDIGRPRREEELGEIDLTSARSCYSMGKRMAEHYCHIYWQEYGVAVKIARLAQTFGKGVRQSDNRVYMQFARSVAEGKDIILKTPGRSMGNYCASEDAVDAVFTILEKGINGETYNVVNEENTMSIREMAELAAGKAPGGNIRVRVEAEDARDTGYAPDTGLRLSGEKLRRLGWRPAKGLSEMYGDVLGEIEAARNGGCR